MTKLVDDEVGLTDKYFVLKPARDEASTDGVLRMFAERNEKTYPVTRKRTWSFVLSPEKNDEYGKASRAAVLAYADYIEFRNPTLANDLRDRVSRALKTIGENRYDGEEEA
jgi:hypothetical protein